MDKRRNRRENRQERREDRDLLPIGLGVAGAGLALYACLEAFRNKEKIDKNADISQSNAAGVAANTELINGPSPSVIWQDYTRAAPQTGTNSEILGKTQFIVSGDVVSGNFSIPIYLDKARTTSAGWMQWNSTGHLPDASKSIYAIPPPLMEISEQITIALSEENRLLFCMNATKTPSGYYVKGEKQVLTKFASGKINNDSTSSSDFDQVEILVTDEVVDEATAGGEQAKLREVIFSFRGASEPTLTLYYSLSDFKA
jgi:hypothetical protein